MTASIPSSPDRFLGRGGRGRRGGEDGALRSGRGGSNRRRLGGGRELGLGHGARIEGEREQAWGSE